LTRHTDNFSVCHKEQNMRKYWFGIDEKVRFAIMASVNMALRFMIFSGLALLFSPERYQLLLAATWFVSSFIAFASYKFLVFPAEGNHLHQYAKSLLIWICSYFINILILTFLIERERWDPYLAQAAAISFLLIVNYLLFKHFAFKPHRPSLLAKIYDIFD